MSPVATGGRTSGNEMMVSTSDLPRHSYRASRQAAASPNGRMTRVLRADTHAVNQTICQSSAVMRRSVQHDEPEFPEYPARSL